MRLIDDPHHRQPRPHSFKCWNLDGHILANIDGGEYVIDTGSPSTYLRAGSVAIGDRTIDGEVPPEGLMEALTRNVSPGIAGLIGVDVLGDYDVHISIPQRSIVFHQDETPLPDSARVDVDRLPQGIPMIRGLPVNGRPCDALLDLGARFSYLAIDEAEASNNFGSAWDFWPLNPDQDNFPVRLHDATLVIAGRECRIAAGDRGDVPGLPEVEIIGSGVLEYFEVNIALQRNCIEFLPIA